MIRFYTGEEDDENTGDTGGPPVGVVKKNRKEAERQAKEIGGYVARRDRFGKFSKRGRNFQAIKSRRKK